MSKADEMNKELEEAKEWINERILYIAENCDLNDSDNKKAYNSLKTTLNYIENSISKETLIEKIQERQFELQQEYIDFKDDIKLNTLQELLEKIEKTR